MPKGVYERTESHRKKIGEARKRYFDQNGRVVNINQKESPEAYREYMKAYQKLWRKKNPHYYRDLKRKKKSQESNYMKKTMKQEVEELQKEITRLQNVIADLEMKIGTQNDTDKGIENEDIDDNLYKSVFPVTQACSEEELMKFTEHK